MASTSPTTAETTGAEFVHVDPATILIGANVRTDLPDAKQFRKSIKERGVLEAVTAYRDEDGQYVCLRGQRRTVTAAEVGTPTGLIPVRVIARPEDADRIGDQLIENLHRAGMRETEIVAGVEQLALLGVSAAQIAKRTAIERPTVAAALAVTKGEQSRARMDSGDLTLEEAATFAEFEHDERATQRLENARWRRGSLLHVAQQLRDEATEQEAYDAEVERLRTEGLPVLSASEADEADRSLPLEDMRTPEGDAVPSEQWATVSGVAVIVTEDWEYPTPTQDDEDEDEDTIHEAIKVYGQMWIVTDEQASGLVHRSQIDGTAQNSPTEDAADDAEEQEARREERRRVIANNKAWTSAETVRREWLTNFLTRKAAPKGAEALICEAVITGHWSLSKAMDHRHPMLFRLLGIEAPSGYYGTASSACHTLATKAATAKGQTMTTLAALLAGWEDSIGKHSWRNPSAWDARVLTSLMDWGYRPSDVERLLHGEHADDQHSGDAA
ncbi:MAG: ParB N-terminal domain-containing protein [Brachybacterium sp.]|nr:ParB N-terminal domain-containing protein [Brachybacterium sp.]